MRRGSPFATMGLWFGIGSFISSSAYAQQVCSPCSAIREAASAALSACDGLKTNALLQCLKPFDALRDQYHACLAAEEEAGAKPAGYCPSKAVGYQAKPKDLPPPPPNCGFERKQGADVPHDINADGIKEFLDKVNDLLEGAHTNVSYNSNPYIEADGRVSHPHVTLTVEVVTPRFGLGRVPPEGRTFMQDIAKLMRQHENKHAAISESILQKLACDMIGKSEKAAKAMIKQAYCKAIPKAQKALDDKEGQIAWVKDSQDRVTGVTTAPYVRPLSDYTPPDCSAPPAK